MSSTDLLRRKIGGIIFTLRTMGPYYLFREIIRRLFDIPYSYCGIKIDSIETFKLVNGLLYMGLNFGVNDNYYFIRTKYGIIRKENIKDFYKLANSLLYLGNDLEYDGHDYFIKTKYGIIYGNNPEELSIVKYEDLEGEYSSLNARNNVVIDVGAYHGETALMFLSWGARMVYAYEPVPEFYNYLIKAIKVNGVEDKVKAFNYGWWIDDGVLRVRMDFACTGSSPGDTGIKVVNSAKELLKISREIGYDFVVKMDCEGCEYSLLTVPCDVLRLAEQYVIEIHGASTLLIDKFTKCGFRYEVIKQLEKYLWIVNFTRY